MSNYRHEGPHILNTPDSTLFGIGNSGRSDDGLGWAFLDAVEKGEFFKGQIAYRYQLGVEDAEQIRDARQIIFVDAFQGKMDNPFQWTTCVPSNMFTFTTHVLPPEGILFLCQELYQKLPLSNILMIKGGIWDLNIGLSSDAQSNLRLALKFFEEHLSMSIEQ